jgi:hypothetical protein
MFQSQNVNPCSSDSTFSYDGHEAVKGSNKRETVLTNGVGTRPFFAKHGRVWKMCVSSDKFSINAVYNLRISYSTTL